jgi:hypothetical protein
LIIDMGGSAEDSPFEAWRRQLLTLTETVDDARDWRRRRYRFARLLGDRLVAATASAPALTGAAIYGIWLNWGVVYVGQTQEAQRRLRDLPIGESHHLANTFPPEIWSRVVVIAWPKFAEVELLVPIPSSAIGLALEHLLQRRLQPLANASRRQSDGTFADVRWETSRSEGARHAPDIQPLFEAVWTAWDHAAQQPADLITEAVRVVFPANLVER